MHGKVGSGRMHTSGHRIALCYARVTDMGFGATGAAAEDGGCGLGRMLSGQGAMEKCFRMGGTHMFPSRWPEVHVLRPESHVAVEELRLCAGLLFGPE